MEIAEVIGKVSAAIPEAEINVEGKDCDFTLTVVWDGFATVPRIRRQQQVLACFSSELATGEIHALSVKTFTTSEWEKSRETSLTQLQSL